MTESEPRERIGSALRALAADLVTEKQRVAVLRKENKRLQAEVDALRRALGQATASADRPETCVDQPLAGAGGSAPPAVS
jgi:hypothetical protein